uniref:Uncharacterized protein n=1 Tax=Rhizophora mucronata TaxID=61149 RepID=A0A2P2NHN9_RHIMU
MGYLRACYPMACCVHIIDMVSPSFYNFFCFC